MEAILPVVLQYLAGTVAALVIGRIAPPTGLGLGGALSLGGLGGVIIGELRDHISGAHHHMNGQVMPGMSMAPATDLSIMLINLIWGAGGGGLFLVLAYAIGRLVPDHSRR